MKEQTGSEFMGELIETVSIEKAELLAFLTIMPQAQKDAVEKAEGFGWKVVGSKKDTVCLRSESGKKMRIDAKGKRVKEVLI